MAETNIAQIAVFNMFDAARPDINCRTRTMGTSTDFNLTPEIEAEFRKRLVVGGPDECWRMSLFGRASKGYQHVRMGKRYIGAHIIACTLANGPRQNGQIVLHSCNKAQCCNPAHLRWGTHAENVADTIAAGRGDKTPIIERFSEAELREMKQMLANGMHVADVAQAFEIGVNSVLKVKRGQIAGHIHVEPTDTRLLAKSGKRKRPGRVVFGSKFSVVDIRRIKNLRGAGLTPIEVARLFETTPDTIRRIDRGEVWAHVLGPEPDNSFEPAKRPREPRPPREIINGPLTSGIVWDIKQDLATGLSPYAVARKHKRADSSVRDIARGKSWASIDPKAPRPDDRPRHEPKPGEFKTGPVSAEDVIAVRKMDAEGMTVAEIYRALRLPQRTVRRIVSGENNYAARIAAAHAEHEPEDEEVDAE